MRLTICRKAAVMAACCRWLSFLLTIRGLRGGAQQAPTIKVRLPAGAEAVHHRPVDEQTAIRNTIFRGCASAGLQGYRRGAVG